MDLNGKSIMVASGSGLGDLIMITPALRRLKEKFPSCRVLVLCRDYLRGVVEGLPFVDKVTCLYRGRFLGRYRVVPDIPGLDAVIFTDYHPAVLFFSTLFRIPVRAGYRRAESRMTNFLTQELKIDIFKSTEYVAKVHAQNISEVLGINLDGDMTRLEVAPPTAENIQSVNLMLDKIGLSASTKYLLLSPFTGFEQRNLPLETAAEFVRLAEERFGLPVVVSGPANKSSAAKNLSSYVLTGATSIGELIELVRRAEFLVTPDSGPMHVAGAVRTKCVALFSKDLPSRWAPRRNCLPLYLALKCSPCNDETARACPHVKCMRGFSAEMILAACEKILAEGT